MRRTIVCVLVVLVIGIISSHVLMAVPQEDWDKDNFGKVVGHVIDADNGEPVTEVFYVRFYDCTNESSPERDSYLFSNGNGYFEKEVSPGVYCVEFIPKSQNSKYSLDPYPPKATKKQVITILKGQVTEFVKKVFLGGKVFIKLVDQNDVPINFERDFSEDADVLISVSSREWDTERLLPVLSKKDVPSLNDGEYMIYSLFPGKFNIYLRFSGVGYVNLKKEGLEIFRGQTHEVKFVINRNDNTGIEGRIIDKNGNPLSDALVWISGEVMVNVRTDSNGYYRMIGAKEGKYSLRIHKEFESGLYFFDIILDIWISRNSITRKDITVDLE